MAGLQFAELPSRSLEFLDFTSVTLDEFQQLVPPFEAVFQARMAADRGACHRTDVPPFAHDGTERRIVRPQDSPAQTECYSGKKKDHTVKNVLIVMPYTDEETTPPGTDAGAATGQPGPALSLAPDRACQQ
jgi:hypothetical protein